MNAFAAPLSLHGLVDLLRQLDSAAILAPPRILRRVIRQHPRPGGPGPTVPPPECSLPERTAPRALAAGCVGLIAGMGLLAVGLAAKSLGVVIAAAIVAGLGQGLSFRAGLQAVNSQAPAGRRGSRRASSSSCASPSRSR